MTEATTVIPRRTLFHFSLPLKYKSKIWTPKSGAKLDESYRLPPLDLLEDDRKFPIDFRLAWSEEGLAFSLFVTGKIHPLWCRTTAIEESDSVQLLVGTRTSQDVQRGTQFHHRFAFLPCSGQEDEKPMAAWLSIPRARGNPTAIPSGTVSIFSKISEDGYQLDGKLAAGALTGFDPDEHHEIAFNYVFLDRDLGQRSYSVGNPLPPMENPSLWQTLELRKE